MLSSLRTNELALYLIDLFGLGSLKCYVYHMIHSALAGRLVNSALLLFFVGTRLRICCVPAVPLFLLMREMHKVVMVQLLCIIVTVHARALAACRAGTARVRVHVGAGVLGCKGLSHGESLVLRAVRLHLLLIILAVFQLNMLIERALGSVSLGTVV